MIPDLSHRYLAVRSGVGHFGFSGNVITQENGTAVILGTTLTAAELIPTDPLPEEGNYCDDCRLCVASCAYGFMAGQEMERVTLGGIDFTYSKRSDYVRCEFVFGETQGCIRPASGLPGRRPDSKSGLKGPLYSSIPPMEYSAIAVKSNCAALDCLTIWLISVGLSVSAWSLMETFHLQTGPV